MKDKAIKDNRFVLEVHPSGSNRVYKPISQPIDFVTFMNSMSSKNGKARRNN
jgi:hypothetical protein